MRLQESRFIKNKLLHIYCIRLCPASPAPSMSSLLRQRKVQIGESLRPYLLQLVKSHHLIYRPRVPSRARSPGEKSY